MNPLKRIPPALLDSAIVAIALFDSFFYLYEPTPFEITMAIAGPLGLFFRRRWPWLSLLLAIPALITSSSSITGLVALYSVAVAERRRWAVLLAGVAIFAGTSVTWWGWIDGGSAIFSIIFAVMTTAAPIALGLLVRTRRELTARLKELEEARESERRYAEEEILATERARIAREMHDVVSHQVSLIAVQAGALQVGNIDPETKTTARTIRSLATKTLDELRQMVTVLRGSGGELSQIAPQPTIADLPELIAASGIPSATTLDLPADLPASVQRAIYRTVQEALTNIRKHAPGATATITAHSIRNDLSVTVHNTAATAPSMQLPASGHGLVGLRERAELLGGTLSEEATSDGGFTLTLTLPQD